MKFVQLIKRQAFPNLFQRVVVCRHPAFSEWKCFVVYNIFQIIRSVLPFIVQPTNHQQIEKQKPERTTFCILKGEKKYTQHQ